MAAAVTDRAHGASDSSRPARLPFVMRRLHSLTGVIPLGAFLLEHLWTNAHVLYGPESFARAVGTIQRLPLLLALETIGIFVPLAFHSLYGVVIALRGRANVVGYPYTRNWLYVLQRASGFVALVFIMIHLWQYRVQKALGHVPWTHFYHRLEVDLNRAGMYALYVTGLTATVFHFANGLWLAANSWGVTISKQSQRRASWFCLAFGVALWLFGMNILLHFAFRCGGVVPLPGQTTCLR
jgi:succinate dehydrogenase / fumarate reductase cytochrome b subunit